MSAPRLLNDVKRHRERLGLSQAALAKVTGVTRQAIIAIESSRQVPSTSLGLLLARALGCSMEELFHFAPAQGLTAVVAPLASPESGGPRVAMGRVGDRWIAHRLPGDATRAADGIVTRDTEGQTAIIQPLADPALLDRNVLVAGCAPLIGALAQRVGARFHDARVTWLGASSQRALDLLQAGLVHVAGVHLGDSAGGEQHVSVVRRMFPGRSMWIVNLTRWRQGFVVAPTNPLAIWSAEDLLRPGLRLAQRDEGAGAQKLVRRLLATQGAVESQLHGPLAAGHAGVAQLVKGGAADVGVAIEGVALGLGLGFVPLVEERFDLVVPAELVHTPPVSRLFDVLDGGDFRTEMTHLPGYCSELSGHLTKVSAAVEAR